MKDIVLVITTAIFGTVTLLIVMTIYGRMNRSMELKSSLPSVLEETVASVLLKHEDEIENDEEFFRYFVKELSACLETQSDIIVDVLQFDREKGIVSVRVTEVFLHPNGKKGTVTCERTVIINKQKEKEEPRWYRVQFVMDGECYKEYEIQENDKIHMPMDPEVVKGTFWGWLDEEGNLAVFPRTVAQDEVFYADVR